MGTRHLIQVNYNGEKKIAQYGQWDGYPSGQGVSVLLFLTDPMNLTYLLRRFREYYDWAQIRFFKEGEPEQIDKALSVLPKELKSYVYDQLLQNRDLGADILERVCLNSMCLLVDDEEFKHDLISCEYHHLIEIRDTEIPGYKYNYHVEWRYTIFSEGKEVFSCDQTFPLRTRKQIQKEMKKVERKMREK